MAQSEKIEELAHHLTKCVNTNYELIKLQATERTSVYGSDFLSIVIVGLVGLFFLLFLSLLAGFYLSTEIGNSYSGFGIVAGFYFLLGIVLFLGRKKLMQKPLRDKIIKTIYIKN